MHVLIVHSYHSTTERGSAWHSVSEDRKQTQAHGIKSGEFAALGFFIENVGQLCPDITQNELCSPALQSARPVMLSAGSTGSELRGMWEPRAGWDAPEAQLGRAQDIAGDLGAGMSRARGTGGHQGSPFPTLRCPLMLIRMVAEL